MMSVVESKLSAPSLMSKACNLVTPPNIISAAAALPTTLSTTVAPFKGEASWFTICSNVAMPFVS